MVKGGAPDSICWILREAWGARFLSGLGLELRIETTPARPPNEIDNRYPGFAACLAYCSRLCLCLIGSLREIVVYPHTMHMKETMCALCAAS